MRRIIQQLIYFLSLSNLVRRYKNKSFLMRIKAAQIYVLAVKKTRIFFLGILGVFIAFVFLINGISLIQAAIFNYSMWSNEVKFDVALAIGCVEILGATGVIIYLFREETWGRFFGIHKVVNLAVNEDGKEKI